MGTSNRIITGLFICLTIVVASCKKELNTNQSNPNGLGINQLKGSDIFAQALLATITDNRGANINNGADNYDYATQWIGYLARTTSYAPAGSQEQMETFGLTNSFSDGNWGS